MTFRWGVLGTGAVAAKFVLGLAASDMARVTMVASRSIERARVFAGALGIPHAVEGHQAVLESGAVDAIYIATPPTEHLGHALAAIEFGVPILVEKPFTRTGEEARTLAEAASSAGVFCMEAMWTRFLPAAQRFRELAGSEVVGEVRQASGSLGFGYAAEATHGNLDPARGGGALTHLAVYPVSLGQWLFGAVVDVSATGRIGDTGVVEEALVSLRYSSGVLASFRASLRSTGVNEFQIMGTHGHLALRGPIYRPWGVTLQRSTPRASAAPGLGRRAQLRERGMVQRIAQVGSRWTPPFRCEAHRYAGNGYHYQADEVARAVSLGLLESPVMPLADSIAVLETLDTAHRLIVTEDEVR